MGGQMKFSFWTKKGIAGVGSGRPDDAYPYCGRKEEGGVGWGGVGGGGGGGWLGGGKGQNEK